MANYDTLRPVSRHAAIGPRIADLATRQHGVVALDQLRALGLSASAVRKRGAAGRLHRVHRGVYAVGHRVLTRRGYYMAAVLACGPGAVLSHREAADLLGLRPSNRDRIDVSVPTGSHRRRRGIQIHRTRGLSGGDVTVVDGIPCTTWARTVIDVAEVGRRGDAEKAIERAEVLQVFDLRELETCLARNSTRRGAAIVGRALAAYRAEAAFTRSDLEKALLAICDSAALPRPSVNTWLTFDGMGGEVDFVWLAERVAVEADGWDEHRTRPAFERDRDRDRRMRLAGWTIVRFTWRQVLKEPVEVERTLDALLRPPGPPRPPARPARARRA